MNQRVPARPEPYAVRDGIIIDRTEVCPAWSAFARAIWKNSDGHHFTSVMDAGKQFYPCACGATADPKRLPRG